jgi:hypothetical protein
MEDFVGRSARRLSPVVHRAWELGARMDFWWENADQAHSVWEQAIDEAELTWKYRQVKNGEWNVFEAVDHYDVALPWEHLDMGINKAWLKEDLKQTLEAATVPDCAFNSCSNCGVCGPNFGHNIAIEPPPIPEFQGKFQPNQNRAQRIRVWFGKVGEMALVSHLDLVRLLKRGIRRGALPISCTGGYHPVPRVSIANALSLRITSIV